MTITSDYIARYGATDRPARRTVTFAEWLGDRDATVTPYRAETRTDLIPAGCPRGLGEGDRTRRIWTHPSGALALGDAAEYARTHADDVRRGYGRVTATTVGACGRMARSAADAAACGMPVSGIAEPATVAAARTARKAAR